MASTLGTNVQTGGTQFQAALRNSQNAIRAMLRSAGVRRPSGEQATGIGGAFDPANLIVNDQGMPSALSPEQVSALTSGTSYGPEGGYSEAFQAGGNIAAEQAIMSRSRGLGGGGLAKQRQELATMQTQRGAADITSALLAGVGEQFGASGQAYMSEQERLANVTRNAADAIAETGSITNPVDPPTVAPAYLPMASNSAGEILPSGQRGAYKKKGKPKGDNIPEKPEPGRTFKGSGGVTFVYRTQGPQGVGWYRKP